MSQPSLPDVPPTTEFTRAVCQCGKELSTLFYLLTARKHFEKFAEAIDLIEEDIDNIGFIADDDLNAIPGLNFCCLITLRYGIREPIAIIPPLDQEARKYPEGLPGPLSKEKTLSWY